MIINYSMPSALHVMLLPNVSAAACFWGLVSKRLSETEEISDLNCGKGDLGYTSTDSFMGCRLWLSSQPLSGTHRIQVAMDQPSSSPLRCFFRRPRCQLLHGYLIWHRVRANTLEWKQMTSQTNQKNKYIWGIAVILFWSF